MNLPDLHELSPDLDDFTVPGGALSSIKRRAAKRRRVTTVAGAALAGSALFAGGFGLASLSPGATGPAGTAEVAGDNDSATAPANAADPTATPTSEVDRTTTSGVTGAAEPIRRGRLRQVPDCAAAKDAIVDGALRTPNQSEIVLSGFDPRFVWPRTEQAPALWAFDVGSPPPVSAPSVQLSISGSSPAISEPNRIVDGVDESDLLITDGRYMIASRHHGLALIDLASGSEPKIVNYDLVDQFQQTASNPPEVYLADDLVWVLTQSAPVEYAPTDGAPARRPGATVATSIEKLRIVDGAFESQGVITVFGALRSSRLIDGTMHLVVDSEAPAVDLVIPEGEGSRDAAERLNRELLNDVALRDWIPAAVATIDGEKVEVDLLDCERVHVPSADSDFGITTVLTLSATDSVINVESTILLAESTTVSASTDRLYLSSSRLSSRLSNWFSVTDIHSFELRDTEPAHYLASGTVEGTVLNEFGVDEHKGVARVASTYRSDAGTGPWTNGVTTLGETDDGELKVLGHVNNLGPDEQIRGVRFAGDRGYVVTFRETDPLYVLDLSDPENPTVDGELKITGFSSYLHPLPDGRLIGIGSEANTLGRVTGAKISLFDTADPTNPTLLDSIIYPHSTLRAASDHRALTWWETHWDTRAWWDTRDPVESSNMSGLLLLPGLFNFDPVVGDAPDAKLIYVDRGLTEVGNLLNHDDLILRTIVVDDEIWALGHSGIGRHDLSGSELIDFLPFDD